MARNSTLAVECVFQNNDVQWCYVVVSGLDNAFHKATFIGNNISSTYHIQQSGVYNVLIYAIKEKRSFQLPTKIPHLFSVISINGSSVSHTSEPACIVTTTFEQIGPLESKNPKG